MNYKKIAQVLCALIFATAQAQASTTQENIWNAEIKNGLLTIKKGKCTIIKSNSPNYTAYKVNKLYVRLDKKGRLTRGSIQDYKQIAKICSPILSWKD